MAAGQGRRGLGKAPRAGDLVIEYRLGDIFEQRDLDFIVHQANLHNTFGSGIAAEIKRRYPHAFEADSHAFRVRDAKLGSYSIGCPREAGMPVVVNLYSQDGISATQRTTHYAAMGHSLLRLEESLRTVWGCERLGVPHGIGCGLAGGDWDVVLPILESAFAKSPITLVVCCLPGCP